MIAEIRAGRLRPGDVLVTPGLDLDALRYGKPHRPVDADVTETVTGVRRKFPALVDITTRGIDRQYGGSCRWGRWERVRVLR